MSTTVRLVEPKAILRTPYKGQKAMCMGESTCWAQSITLVKLRNSLLEIQ